MSFPKRISTLSSYISHLNPMIILFLEWWYVYLRRLPNIWPMVAIFTRLGKNHIIWDLFCGKNVLLFYRWLNWTKDFGSLFQPVDRMIYGGETSLEGNNSSSICYVTFLVYFTIALQPGCDVINSQVACSIFRLSRNQKGVSHVQKPVKLNQLKQRWEQYDHCKSLLYRKPRRKNWILGISSGFLA